MGVGIIEHPEQQHHRLRLWFYSYQGNDNIHLVSILILFLKWSCSKIRNINIFFLYMCKSSSVPVSLNLIVSPHWRSKVHWAQFELLLNNLKESVVKSGIGSSLWIVHSILHSSFYTFRCVFSYLQIVYHNFCYIRLHLLLSDIVFEHYSLQGTPYCNNNKNSKDDGFRCYCQQQCYPMQGT